jgi:hypothetical protein
MNFCFLEMYRTLMGEWSLRYSLFSKTRYLVAMSDLYIRIWSAGLSSSSVPQVMVRPLLMMSPPPSPKPIIVIVIVIIIIYHKININNEH